MLAKPHMSWHLSREYTGEGFRSECLFHYAEQLPLLHDLFNKAVDWSATTPGGRHQLIRASVASQGRTLTIFEAIYTDKTYN